MTQEELIQKHKALKDKLANITETIEEAPISSTDKNLKINSSTLDQS